MSINKISQVYCAASAYPSQLIDPNTVPLPDCSLSQTTAYFIYNGGGAAAL